MREFAPKRSLAEVADQILEPRIREAYQQNVEEEHRSAYRDAMAEHRPRLQALFRNYLDKHRLSAYIVPAAPSTAPLIGEDDTFTLGGQSVPTRETLLRNTSPSSIAGYPSLVLPAGLSGAGLPVGLMLESTAGQDQELIALGSAIAAVLEPIAPPQP